MLIKIRNEIRRIVLNKYLSIKSAKISFLDINYVGNIKKGSFCFKPFVDNASFYSDKYIIKSKYIIPREFDSINIRPSGGIIYFCRVK
jgi:hypothetical protein